MQIIIYRYLFVHGKKGKMKISNLLIYFRIDEC